jgi:hypothetical protein
VGGGEGDWKEVQRQRQCQVEERGYSGLGGLEGGSTPEVVPCGRERV